MDTHTSDRAASSHEAAISKIKIEIGQALTNLSISKRELILQWATHLEELHKDGRYTKPIDSICKSICFSLEHELGISRMVPWVYDVLPDRYKNKQFQALGYQGGHQKAITAHQSNQRLGIGQKPGGRYTEDTTEDLVIRENSEPTYHSSTENVPNPPLLSASPDPLGALNIELVGVRYIDSLTNEPLEWNQLNRDQKREWAEHLRKQKIKLEDIVEGLSKKQKTIEWMCWNEKIPLLAGESEYYDNQHGSTAEKHMFEESSVVSTPKPPAEEQGPSEVYWEMEHLEETVSKFMKSIQAIKKKLWTYKPNDEDASRAAKAVVKFTRMWDEISATYIEFVKAFGDEKWAFDNFDWMDVQLDNIAHGKHAAATMHRVGVFSEESSRPLTREQVGDRQEIMFKVCKKTTRAVSMFFELHTLRKKYMNSRIAWRRKHLNPKLSEKA